MNHVSLGPVLGPAQFTECDAEIVTASKIEFELRNKKRRHNFIYGSVSNAVLTFIVYNLPSDGLGCAGWWLFQQMWLHFQVENVAIDAVAGNWSRSSTNLLKVNTLTANSAMTLEEASRQTNTGGYARAINYTNVVVFWPDPLNPLSVGTLGSPGKYTRVKVHFTK